MVLNNWFFFNFFITVHVCTYMLYGQFFGKFELFSERNPHEKNFHVHGKYRFYHRLRAGTTRIRRFHELIYGTVIGRHVGRSSGRENAGRKTRRKKENIRLLSKQISTTTENHWFCTVHYLMRRRCRRRGFSAPVFGRTYKYHL